MDRRGSLPYTPTLFVVSPRPDMPCAILTYHSQIISANRYGANDHLTLARDLELITDAGLRIVSLGEVIDALSGRANGDALEGTVALTFDDGALLDFEDVEHPVFGQQRGFLNILRDFQSSRGGGAQSSLHATSFVIASREAREMMDQRSLFGLGWMNDSWWAEAARDPLMAVASHGWDHNHPDLDPGDPARGRFDNVDNEADCLLQVVQASREIAAVTGGDWPICFAYPFGQSSDYLRDDFLPNRTELHRLEAAVGTEPDYVARDSARWNLPRFVSGRDWRTEDEFKELLGGLG